MFCEEHFISIKSLNGKTYEENETIGKTYTVSQIIDEVTKDSPFFDESGGGVTLSGGEPLSQPEFCIELIRILKSKGINVALDTCGYAPWRVMEATIPFTDLYLFDIKLINNEQHKKYTGVGNEIILSNLKDLSKTRKTINIRLPLVEGITDTNDNIKGIAKYLSDIDCTQHIDLLPYHTLAKSKFKRFYGEYTLNSLSDYPKEKAELIKVEFEKIFNKVTIGG
jgi:pyruvate formate lyase activating enzyme